MSVSGKLHAILNAVKKGLQSILRGILIAVGILITLFINYIFYRIWVGQSIFPWWGP